MARRGRKKYLFSDKTEDQFLTDIQIVKQAAENCDYERTIDAMTKYISYYEYYSDWLLKGSIKTGWDLWNNESQLKITADILTSISVPYKCLKTIDKEIDSGEEIKNFIISMEREKGDFFIEGTFPYIRAFAAIYYSLGNMMPTIRNFSPNINRKNKYETLDNWNYKLNYIKNNLNKGSSLEELRTSKKKNGLWGQWVADLWGDNEEKFVEFLCANYFIDVWDKKTSEIKPIVSTCGEPAKSISNLDSYYLKENSEINFVNFVTEWFSNNIKIIIQRSYRILQQSNDKFTKAEIEFIGGIFKKINDEYGTNLSDELF